MQTFLEETARHLLLNHKTDLADVCVVLPGRRAGIYLKKHISELAQKTLWAPDIFSIEDFLVGLSGYNKLDNVTLTFELYEIHKEIEKENPQTFEEFSKWGQVMLGDFNEIDMSLVDAGKLFDYLSEVKAIEKWNPDGSPLTRAEREYLRFYKSLYKYYQDFNDKLKANKNAYQGLIYRHVAENIESLMGEKKWKKIYFAGFNAFTKAEEKVIHFLRDTFHAEILRDADAYYLEDEQQEAGEFLRKQLQAEGKEKFGEIRNFFKDPEKKIHIHGVSGNEGQAGLTGKILQDWLTQETPNKIDLTNTAIVLANENLLIPVLNALPAQLDAFNVTMGYPLKLTPAYNFVILLIRMYENTERFAKMKGKNEEGFYHRDILRILQHSMMAGTYNTQKAIQGLRKSKQVFYNYNDIEKIFFGDDKNNIELKKFSELATTIFSDPLPHPGLIIEKITKIIIHFRAYFSDKNNETGDFSPLQLEYLYHLSEMVNRLKAMNETYKSIETVKTLRGIFRQLSASNRIPFSGEPLKGLQIMGMLETRNLDFERVILVSANEGVLPATSTNHSLIPFDVQLEMKLPTHKQKNAVFAYHFYRLLQRAKETHIIYDTESDKMGSGEKSRFVYQILNELPQYNPDAEIINEIEDLPPLGKMSERIIEIQKTDSVFRSLCEKAADGLSPTSLNQYRRCPLQFYFKNLAKLRELDDVEENLEYRTIGSIIHTVLEELYKPFLNKIIKATDIDEMYGKVEVLTAMAFQEHYEQGQTRFGKNRLILEVIKSYLSSFLNFEKKFLQNLKKENGALQIQGLEKKLMSENLAAYIPGMEQAEIKIKGVIDRIDKLNNTTRIIDYKTGKVSALSDLQIYLWEDFEEGHKKDKPFQVLLYAWLHQRTSLEESPDLQAGVISLPVMSKEFIKFGVKPNRFAKADENIDAEKLENFEQYLISLLKELFDQTKPFIQTDRKETCQICDFKEICRR